MRRPSLALSILPLLIACTPDEPDPEGPPPVVGVVPDPGSSQDVDQDGFTVDEGDCDDGDPSVHPGAFDQPYDGIDADCDGADDFDADRDGYRAASYGGLDCDDRDDAVYPGAIERCNGVDDDCDDLVDVDDDDLVDAFVRYVDADGDGFGDATAPVTVCVESEGLVEDATDCDDASDTTYPGAVPVPCDGLDNDCDPATPEPVFATVDGVPVPDLRSALQDAFDHSTIELCDGVYQPPGLLLLQDDLTIRGAGPGVTVIDAQGAGRILGTFGQDVVFEGLTIANGDTRPEVWESQGGCLWVRDGSLTLVDVVVRDCLAAGNGAAIYLDPGVELELQRVTIRDNRTSAYGGAIATTGHLLSAGATVRATDTLITGNHATAGGALDLRDGRFDGGGSTRIEANVAHGAIGTGGVRILGGELVGVEIVGNQGGMPGFPDNGPGGLKFVKGGRIADVTLIGNLGEPPAAVIGQGDTIVERLTVTDHSNPASRSVVRIEGGNTVITDGVFHRNAASLAMLRFTTYPLIDGPTTLQLVSSDFGTGPTANQPTDLVFYFGDTVDVDGVVDLSCDTDDAVGGCY